MRSRHCAAECRLDRWSSCIRSMSDPANNDGTCHLLVMNEKRDVALKAQDLKV